MPKKNNDEHMASFFGEDDLDWLADEDSQEVGEGRRAPASPSSAPVDAIDAPPPPVPDLVAPPEPPAVEPAELRSEPSMDLPVAPPPPPTAATALEPRAVALEPLPVAVTEDDPSLDFGALPPAEDMPTVLGIPQGFSMPSPMTGVAPPPMPKPIVDDFQLPEPSVDLQTEATEEGGESYFDEPGVMENEAFADDFDERSEEIPMVRTAEPAVGREHAPSATEPVAEALGWASFAEDEPVVASPSPEAEPEMSGEAAPSEAPAAPVAPDSSLLASVRVPQGEWGDLVAALMAEAGAAAGAERVALLVQASDIAFHRTGDSRAAFVLAVQANAAGGDDLDLWTLFAASAMELQDWVTAHRALVACAERTEGPAAAERWREAAVVAGSQLGDAATAGAHLRAAVLADPDDYVAWRWLSDHLDAAGLTEPRVEALQRLAELSSSAVAAELWRDQGQVLLVLGRVGDARAAFERSLSSDPTYAPAFLALEAIFTQTGDDAALAALYRAEAARAQGAERCWWLRRAAHAEVDAGNVTAARELLAEGVALHDEASLRALQVLCLSQDDTAAYADLCEAEVALCEVRNRGVSFAHYRHGQAREALGDTARALAAFRAAVAVDPSAGPAAESVARLLKSSGDLDGLSNFWAERIATAEDLSVKTALLLRLGEIAETAGDQVRARDAFRAAIAIDPGFCSALEGLLRVCTRLGEWAEVADIHEQRAAQVEDVSQQALHIYRSGRARQRRLDDESGARSCFERALERVPDHPAALDALLEILEARDAWTDMGAVLRRAGEHAADLPEKTSLLYRAGRVYADKADRLDEAIECLRLCTMVTPDFLPAIGLLKELAGRGGGSEEVYRLHRSEAEALTEPNARRWRFLAAAEVARQIEGFDGDAELQGVLDADPRHPGALPIAELRFAKDGQHESAGALYRNAAMASSSDDERARWLVRLVAQQADSGDAIGAADTARELASMMQTERPLRGVARLIASQQFWEDASRLLAQATDTEDKLERARLLAHRLGQPGLAAELLIELLSADEPSTRVAQDLSQLVRANGSSPVLLRAHNVLAQSDASPPVRAAHMLWAAAVAEDLGDVEQAGALYQSALQLRPSSREALAELERVLLERHDADGLSALYQGRDPAGLTARARVMQEGGNNDRAADMYAEALTGTPTLAQLFEASRAFLAVERWREAYAVLERIRAQVQEPNVRADVDGHMRQLLADHLYATDEAWELYQRLHEQTPEDRDVTRALARIAGARGEVALGIGYLAALAAGADTPRESADLALEIAGVHRLAGDLDAASQACFDALDHVPDEARAIEQLKQIAAERDDYVGLVSVLRREASLLRGEPRLAALRGIATITQQHLDQPAVALDAWRAVLDESPEDGEALRASTAIAAAVEDWGAFMDLGQRLLPLTTSDERGDLLFQIGVAAQDHLLREDAASFFEKAIANIPPNVPAAARLERLCRQYGDLTGAVRCILVQADGTEDVDAKVKLLLDAAGVESMMNHNRDAAAVLYARVLELKPEHQGALEYRARFLLDAGSAEALDLFSRLEPKITDRKDMEDFDVRMEVALFFYDFARLLSQHGRFDDAIPRYDRALELNPTHLPTLEAVAPLYMEREQWRKAERVLRQLLQLTGGHGNKADMARTYTSLGMVEHALGQSEKAAKRFNKALELSPNHLDALKGMALVLEDQNDWNTALNFYNNIIYQATVPADVIQAYMTKGRILDEHMGRPDKAAQHYERSLAFDANQPAALLRLAELAMRRAEWAEAGGLVQRGLRLEARPSALRSELLLGWAASRLASGDDRGAHAAITEALAGAPALVEALGPSPLADLDGMVAGIRARLPR